MHTLSFIRNNYINFKNKLGSCQLKLDKIFFLKTLIDINLKKIFTLKQLRNKLLFKEKFTYRDKKIKNTIFSNYNLRIQIKLLNKIQSKLILKFKKILFIIPNLPLVCNTHYNIIIRKFLTNKRLIKNINSHFFLGKNLGLIDFDNVIKISGSRFVILKKDIIKLERALVNFMISIHVNFFGYIEILPPSIVLEDVMYKTGQLPKFDLESFKSGNYRFIPTSEVSILAIFINTLISEYNLPRRYVSYTQCYRSEFYSSNKDTKGMIRQKQFSKIELISIVDPNNSFFELERITNAAETILKKLLLPYRIILLSISDMGFCSHKTYDIEVWLPYERKYREVSSCSNCGDFQARRMNTKYVDKNGNKKFVHTLNGSGLAIGRTIVAILENYQNFNGGISIPYALNSFMDNQKFITNIY